MVQTSSITHRHAPATHPYKLAVTSQTDRPHLLRSLDLPRNPGNTHYNSTLV